MYTEAQQTQRQMDEYAGMRNGGGAGGIIRYFTIVVVGHLGSTGSPAPSLDGGGGQGTGVHMGHIQVVQHAVQAVHGESAQRGERPEGGSSASQ